MFQYYCFYINVPYSKYISAVNAVCRSIDNFIRLHCNACNITGVSRWFLLLNISIVVKSTVSVTRRHVVWKTQRP